MKKNLFLQDCRSGEALAQLFEGLHDVLFFVKNRDCELVAGNQLLLEHMGLTSIDELAAVNDFDVFSTELAQQYRDDDQEVMNSGVAKRQIIELFPNYLGDLTWFITSKIPLFDNDGQVCGLCGTLERYEGSHQFLRPFKEITKALDYIKDNYKTKISTNHLADLAGLSLRQFENRFKEVFDCTPYKYVIKLRILESCKMLMNKNVNISETALELGFYDQSAFSNTFKKHLGVTPLKYIRNHKSSK